MKKVLLALLVLLLLFVAAVLVADWYVRGLVEEHAELELGKALPQAEGVHVKLDGFPFVLGVAVTGEVKALHIAIDKVREAGVEAHDLRLDVDTIALDTDAMIDEQRLVVSDIGTAKVEGLMTDDEISKAVKREVVFEPGSVHAKVKGHDVTAKAEVKGRTVQLSASIPGVAPLVFPLPPKEVLPCEPELEILEGELRLSCSIDALPDTLRQAMAR